MKDTIQYPATWNGKIAYISGPMTGRLDFNFPAFYDAENVLLHRGYAVLNPARNFDGETDRTREEYMLVDLKNVLRADAVFVLEGWEKSRGALLEVLVGKETGKKILCLDSDWEPWAVRGVHVSLTETGKEIPSLDKEGEPRGVKDVNNPLFVEAVKGRVDQLIRDLECVVDSGYPMSPLSPILKKYHNLYRLIGERSNSVPNHPSVIASTKWEEKDSEETILDEAERIVGGARNKQYGHPLDDFTKTGRIWAVVLGLEEVTPEQVALCMALGVKGSRLIKDPQHHDSMVDCAGYIRCLDRINRRREGLE